MLNHLRDADGAEYRIQWVRLSWAIFGIALFAVTYKLWTGQTDFPQVPLLRCGHLLPLDVVLLDVVLLDFDKIGLVGIVLSLVVTLWTTNLSQPQDRVGWLGRSALAFFCIALGTLMIANQHRLQPWAYLAWLTAWVLLHCRSGQAVFLLRLLIISVYLHSAISKADYEFLATIGQTFLKSVGFSLGAGRTALFAASVFPLAEFSVGVGLYFRRSRRWAIAAAVLMHVVLMVVLSPLRLKHEPAVLVWNAYFIWQVVVLFGWSTVRDSELSGAVATELRSKQTFIPSGSRSWANVVATIVVGAAVTLPLLEPFGWFDHWPSWGLYAPRNSRCHLYVDEVAVEKLPDAWRQGLRSSLNVQHGWSPGLEIPLSRQSLELLDVPIYPQDRFQLGVAIAIARRYGLGDETHVVWESGSARLSGRRKRQTFHGLKEIEAATNRFWLNVEPRAKTP